MKFYSIEHGIFTKLDSTCLLARSFDMQYSYLRGFIIRTWVLADNYLIMCHVSVQRWSTRQRYTYITVINDMTAVWAIPAPCFCNQFLYLVMPLQVVSHGLQQKEHIGAGSQVNVKENLKTVKLNRIFFSYCHFAVSVNIH